MHGYTPAGFRVLLPMLDRWRALPQEFRWLMLGLEPRYQTPAPRLRELPLEVRAALLDEDDQGRVRPVKEFQLLLAFVRRLLEWCPDEGIDITRYVQRMTGGAQRSSLSGQGMRTSMGTTTVAMENRIEEGWFAKAVAASPGAEAFLAEIGGWQGDGRPYDDTAHRDLKKWLAAKLGAPDRVPMIPLGTETFRLPGLELPPEDLLYLVVEYGLGVIGTSPNTLLPILYLPTRKGKKRQDPKNIVLQPFHGRETFSRPFLLDDMEAYLRDARSRPVPLLSDGRHAPVAHHRKVAKGFLALPFEVGAPGWEGEFRAAAAFDMIMALELMEDSGLSGRNFTVIPGADADAWLSLPRERKLGEVLKVFPCGVRMTHEVYERFAFLGDFAVHPFPYGALDLDLMLAMDGAVALLQDPVDMTAWMNSAVDHANPMRAALESDPDRAARWRRWEGTPEEIYDRLLSFHVARLCSAGLLALHVDSKRNIGISLTEAGLWIFGKAETWSLPSEARPLAVVGGDFTVTLLEASLACGTELAAFAEPVGETLGTGAVYKITKKSVQKAAHGGVKPEAMVATLKSWSKHALPANVVHEIGHWAGARKTLKVRETVLIESGDPLLLAELCASAPKDFEKVSDHALRYTGKTKPQALMQRLGRKGYLFE
jgi:hypothetical protein